ncbi:hypothetical protein A3C18_01020 [Candidatus Kaiserbacteria bacterium RIFCSPHIGHO2_02_FULL_54_11b]|uniref:Uncharacterized protein n=2 Tax=Candidatus Kaiseribacteriota TaxID=1752734 RepID=A0A1F6CL35_9BACT|nr:MAG: hypothetical protein A2704_06965 [Candidatus Kaiserbacteria bacterium RIFCSPHIGHO2_01_FULL_54_36b]OGG63876.1 MAG: hypothetical protein A3C18_01020 [Candidatus Kaiserbacteria bacterium RIFCSPHIGHO2_02_FULL_54_11b]
MNGEPTNHEILEAIQTFSSSVDQRFDRVDQRLDRVEATMVTKDYLDEKLADLRGDLVVLTRKEDAKVRTLVEILRERKVLTDDDAKRILSMEPFPQLAL